MASPNLELHRSPSLRVRRGAEEGSAEPRQALSSRSNASESRSLLEGEQQQQQPGPAEGGSTPEQRGRRVAPAAALAAIVGIVLLLASARHRGWTTAADPAAPHGFVSVRGLQLEASCRPLYIAGFNCDTLALAPVARAGRRVQPGERSGRSVAAELATPACICLDL